MINGGFLVSYHIGRCDVIRSDLWQISAWSVFRPEQQPIPLR